MLGIEVYDMVAYWFGSDWIATSGYHGGMNILKSDVGHL